MRNQKAVFVLWSALAAFGAIAAEPNAQEREKGTAVVAEHQQNAQRIEREIQSKIDAELMADIEADNGIKIIVQNARLIRPTVEPGNAGRRLAQLDAE